MGTMSRNESSYDKLLAILTFLGHLRADTSDRKSWVMLSGSFLPINKELIPL